MLTLDLKARRQAKCKGRAAQVADDHTATGDQCVSPMSAIAMYLEAVRTVRASVLPFTAGEFAGVDGIWLLFVATTAGAVGWRFVPPAAVALDALL